MAADLELDDKKIRAKRLIVCDLDGTLTESKTDMEPKMSEVMVELLKCKEIAVIGGQWYPRFQEQFVRHLKCPPALLERLYLFPTCGSAFYRYKEGAWAEVYAEKLTDSEKRKIMDAFAIALPKAGYVKPEVTYGDILEDRIQEIAFSAFGQRTPVPIKRAWDPDGAKRQAIRRYLIELIPEFEVNVSGMTTIDVTRKGIDKAYGIRKITEYLKYSIDEMLFIGDALFDGGNDYPVKKSGVDCIMVGGPADTINIFSKIV
jgi:hypothetical protein